MDVYLVRFQPDHEYVQDIGVYSSLEDAQMVAEGHLNESRSKEVLNWSFDINTNAAWYLEVGYDAFEVHQATVRTL